MAGMGIWFWWVFIAPFGVFLFSATLNGMTITTPLPPPAAHSLPYQVQIFDTDCYGVMWHGAYHRWLELARCEYFKALGCPLADLNNEGPEGNAPLVFPVAEQNLAYHAPAKLWDDLTITTRIQKKGVRIIFHQQVVHAATNKALVTATTTCAIMQESAGRWRPARNLPAPLTEALANSNGAA